jgi:hypothetical protein
VCVYMYMCVMYEVRGLCLPSCLFDACACYAESQAPDTYL